MITNDIAARHTPRVTMGDRLRRLRRTYGMDQQAFADSCGLSKSLIAKIELLDSDPPNPRMLLLSVHARYGGQVRHWLESGCENPACPHSDSNREPTDYKIVARALSVAESDVAATVCVATCGLAG